MLQPILITPDDASATTVWLNPLSVPQKVDVHVNGRLSRYKIDPGKKVEIPSVYDSAIHIVHGCNDDTCRMRGGPCRKPGQHGGVVAGGLAPQLVNVGAAEKMGVIKALDTETSDREEREAALRLAARTVDASEKALMAATVRMDAETAPKPAASTVPVKK